MCCSTPPSTLSPSLSLSCSSLAAHLLQPLSCSLSRSLYVSVTRSRSLYGAGFHHAPCPLGDGTTEPRACRRRRTAVRLVWADGGSRRACLPPAAVRSRGMRSYINPRAVNRYDCCYECWSCGPSSSPPLKPLMHTAVRCISCSILKTDAPNAEQFPIILQPIPHIVNVHGTQVSSPFPQSM